MCLLSQDRIIPPGPITALEKKQTLQRLSQTIELRIVTTDLPRHMCRPVIGQNLASTTLTPFYLEHTHPFNGPLSRTTRVSRFHCHVPWTGEPVPER